MSLKEDETYFISSGDVAFSVEDTLFRIHKYFLERESAFFRDTIASAGAYKGRHDNNPIYLANISPLEFSRFLWVFYNPKFHYENGLAEWSSILRLAHMWEFPEVKELAIRHLDQLDIPPVDKIVLCRDYDVNRNWLLASCTTLGARKSPLTIEEGKRLGIDLVVKIAELRERIRDRRYNKKTELEPNSAEDFQTIQHTPSRSVSRSDSSPHTPDAIIVKSRSRSPDGLGHHPPPPVVVCVQDHNTSSNRSPEPDSRIQPSPDSHEPSSPVAIGPTPSFSQVYAHSELRPISSSESYLDIPSFGSRTASIASQESIISPPVSPLFYSSHDHSAARLSPPPSRSNSMRSTGSQESYRSPASPPSPVSPLVDLSRESSDNSRRSPPIIPSFGSNRYVPYADQHYEPGRSSRSTSASSRKSIMMRAQRAKPRIRRSRSSSPGLDWFYEVSPHPVDENLDTHTSLLSERIHPRTPPSLIQHPQSWSYANEESGSAVQPEAPTPIFPSNAINPNRRSPPPIIVTVQAPTPNPSDGHRSETNEQIVYSTVPAPTPVPSPQISLANSISSNTSGSQTVIGDLEETTDEDAEDARAILGTLLGL